MRAELNLFNYSQDVQGPHAQGIQDAQVFQDTQGFQDLQDAQSFQGVQDIQRQLELSKALKHLSDQQLHQKMLKTSQTERELTAQMISLIQEASRRKFYLDLGYGTLFGYLTEGLKYSAASAMRRIESAKIAHDIPEVKEKVLDGSLTLSNLARAQQFFKNEAKANHKMDVEEKKDVLKMLEGQSTREAERTLASLSTQPVQMAAVEQVKPLTKDLSKISFLADEEFMNQLEEVKGLLASKMPGASVSEILAEVMKLGLLSLRKKRFKIKTPIRKDASEIASQFVSSNTTSGAGSKEQEQLFTTSKSIKSLGKSMSTLINKPLDKPLDKSISKPINKPISTPNPEPKSPAQVSPKNRPARNRYIPAAVQRQVSQRDGNQCTRINPKTHKRCGSKYDLQFDHYPISYADGGDHSVENLRLVCRSCNLLHGVKRFGRKVMTSYR